MAIISCSVFVRTLIYPFSAAIVLRVKMPKRKSKNYHSEFAKRQFANANSGISTRVSLDTTSHVDSTRVSVHTSSRMNATPEVSSGNEVAYI